MGDVWQAYEFIQKSNLLSASMDHDAPVMEMVMKDFLAKRQGIKGDILEINEHYEISMELVKRKEPLPEKVLEEVKALAEKQGIV